MQRADLDVYIAEQPFRQALSHGQQKLVVTSLLLAQVDLFMRETGRQCVLLLDDLPGELDTEGRGRLLSAIAQLRTQTFVTALQASDIDATEWRAHAMFHVEHGRLHAC